MFNMVSRPIKSMELKKGMTYQIINYSVGYSTYDLLQQVFGNRYLAMVYIIVGHYVKVKRVLRFAL